MIDTFVVLTPILLLGLVALLRFIGCNALLGLDPTTVAPSTPVLKSLSPSFVTQGDPNFSTLTVAGAGFLAPNDPNHPGSPFGSKVQWNGNDLATTFLSGTMLEATVTPDLIAAPGQAQITVSTANVAGPFTSNTLPFDIIGNAVVITFDLDALGGPPPGVPGDTIDAPYKNINFGVGQWIWNGPTGVATGNSIRINYGGAGDVSRTFSFAGPSGPRVLKQIRVFVELDPDATQVPDLTITDDNAPPQTVSQNILQADGLVSVSTGWTLPSGTVTVRSTLGQYFHLDRIVYQGPA
jgi:hypothetical protein